MKLKNHAFCLCLLALISHGAHGLTFLPKTQIKVKHPAFLHIKESFKTSKHELYISSFGLTSQDNISKISDLGASLSAQSIKTESFIPKILWPNEIVEAPDSLFGADFMIISEGFLVPLKNTGAIELYDVYKKELKTLTKPKKGYWYHRVEFWDYNQDGRLDIISARAKKAMMGTDDGELIALIAPENPLTDPWKEEIILKGPDVFFRLVDFDQDKRFEVISAEFLSKKLSYYYQDETGVWRENVIDKSIGNLFEVQLTDLNKDGQRDLLVTNHVNNEAAGVFAYEIPKSPKTEAFKKHVLYQGFVTSSPGVGQASPGIATTYYPTKNEQAKPYIIVSGDGAESAHLLSPLKEDSTDWSYKEEVILKTKGAVGQLAVADADMNGFNEIYIPEYDQNRIQVIEPNIKNVAQGHR